MKIHQIVFEKKSTVTVVEKDWEPEIQPNEILIKSVYSMISPGTELAALHAYHSRSNTESPPKWLQFPSVPGYMVCGYIVDVGKDVTNVNIGDRVLGHGSGVWNSHSGYVKMTCNDPKLEKIPDKLTFDEAIFTSLG